MYIRIIKVPADGEAPRHIKEKWVGLTLPLTDRSCGLIRTLRRGRITSLPEYTHACSMQNGIQALLNAEALDAVAWWQQWISRHPIFGRHGELGEFAFRNDECQFIDAD